MRDLRLSEESGDLRGLIEKLVEDTVFDPRHARASAVEIEIGFDRRGLGLRIHDNGVGLDADVLSKGEKEGHFGLVGMRERAARIGGTLTIESGAGMGTDLTLTTPARIAFPRSMGGRWRRFRAHAAPA